MTLKTRLAKAELLLQGLQPPPQGPVIRVVAVGADGVGRCSAEGEQFAVTSRSEFEELLVARGWQPGRVIYTFPSLRDAPGVEARFNQGRQP